MKIIVNEINSLHYQYAIEKISLLFSLTRDLPQDKALDVMQFCLYHHGVCDFSAGDVVLAIEKYTDALKISAYNHDIDKKAAILISLGIAYDSVADSKASTQYYYDALTLYEQKDNIDGMALCVLYLGVAYDNLGESDRAIEYYTKALEIYQMRKNVTEQANCYTNLGVAYDRKGVFEKAIEYYTKALEIYQTTGDVIGQSICYLNLGISTYRLGNLQDAVDLFKKSYEISQKIQSLDGISLSCLYLGQIYYTLDRRRSCKYLLEGIDVYERIDKSLIEEKHKLVSKRINADIVYEYIILICINSGYVNVALDYLQRRKSRILLDLLSKNLKLHPKAPMTAELRALLKKEEELLGNIRSVQLSHLGGDINRDYEIALTLKRLDEIYVKIGSIDEEYVQLKRGIPVNLETVQSLIKDQK